MLCDTQLVDKSFLEDVNNMLSSGEVPNLFRADEFEDVSITCIAESMVT